MLGNIMIGAASVILSGVLIMGVSSYIGSKGKKAKID